MIGKTETLTRELYEADSELFDFTARVLSCGENGKGGYAVELDQTAFFPEGGGQYADTGLLDNARVSDVRRREGRIYHMTDQPLSVGSTVQGRIDADVRMARMQNHTGEHIISGLVWSKYGYTNVGFHLGNGEMTLDFDHPLDAEQLADIEVQANRVVWANLPVRAEYPDEQTLASLSYRSKLELTENVRIVTVEGVDCCACCAPHVKTTGEIGLIKIVSASHYKGGVRLWVLCGAWALEDYRQKHETVLAISRKYSVKPEGTLGAVLRADEELLKTKAALSASRRALMQEQMKNRMPNVAGNLVLTETDLDSNEQRYLADLGAGMCPSGLCAVLVAAGEECRYVCVSRSRPLKEVAKQLRERFGGGGGGSDSMIQGSARATAQQLSCFFEQIK